jgi:hypothetical protein
MIQASCGFTYSEFLVRGEEGSPSVIKQRVAEALWNWQIGTTILFV